MAKFYHTITQLTDAPLNSMLFCVSIKPRGKGYDPPLNSKRKGGTNQIGRVAQRIRHLTTGQGIPGSIFIFSAFLPDEHPGRRTTPSY